MLDALCQGIESWWSVNSTDESKLLSKAAVEEIMKWWHEYIFENTDESAKYIMHAANLAGQAICITQTTAAHAFSYKITSLYKLPHGHAVAVCLPEIWQYMSEHIDECLDKRGTDYLNDIFNDIAKAMGANSPFDAIVIFRNLMMDLELQKPVSDLSHRISDLDKLSSSVNPVRLKNNPVGLDLGTIKFLYSIIVRN
jgi:alcohol dehydrogenase class IV